MEVLEAVGINEAFHERGTTTTGTTATTTTMDGAQVQRPVQPPPAPAGSGSGRGSDDDSDRPRRPSLVTAALRHVLHAHAMAPHSIEDNFSMDQPDEEEPAEHDLEEIERRILNKEPLAAPHKRQLREQTPEEREEFVARLKSNLGHQFQELELIETGDASDLVEDMDLDRILGMDTQSDAAQTATKTAGPPATSILQQAQQKQQQLQQRKGEEYKPVVSETLKMLNDTEKALHRGRQRSDSDTRTATQVSSLSDILEQEPLGGDAGTKTRPRSRSYTATYVAQQAVPSSEGQGEVSSSSSSSSWWPSWWPYSSSSTSAARDDASSSTASTPAVSKQSSLEEGTQFQFDDTVPFLVAPSTIIYPPNADGTESRQKQQQQQQRQQQSGPRTATQQPREQRGGRGGSGSGGDGGDGGANIAANPSFFDTGTETTYSQEKAAKEGDEGQKAKSASSRTIGSVIKSTAMGSNSNDDDDQQEEGDEEEGEQQRQGVFKRLKEGLENVLAEMHTAHAVEPDHYNDDFGQNQVQPFIMHAFTPEEWVQEHPEDAEPKKQGQAGKGTGSGVVQLSSLLSKSGNSSSKKDEEEGDDSDGESQRPVLDELANIAAQLHNFRALEPHEYNDNFSCDQPLHESVVEALTPEELKEEIEHHLRNPPTATATTTTTMATGAVGGTTSRGMTTVGDGVPDPLDIDAASLTSSIQGVMSAITTTESVVGPVADMMEGDDDEKLEQGASTTRVM